MATYPKESQYIIRIEFHDVKEAPNVYRLFYKELEGSIFLVQMRKYSDLHSTFYDLADGTYFYEGTLPGTTLLTEANALIQRTLAAVAVDYPAAQISGHATVLKLSSRNPILTTLPAVPKAKPRG